MGASVDTEPGKWDEAQLARWLVSQSLQRCAGDHGGNVIELVDFQRCLREIVDKPVLWFENVTTKVKETNRDHLFVVAEKAMNLLIHGWTQGAGVGKVNVTPSTLAGRSRELPRWGMHLSTGEPKADVVVDGWHFVRNPIGVGGVELAIWRPWWLYGEPQQMYVDAPGFDKGPFTVTDVANFRFWALLEPKRHKMALTPHVSIAIAQATRRKRHEETR